MGRFVIIRWLVVIGWLVIMGRFVIIRWLVVIGWGVIIGWLVIIIGWLIIITFVIWGLWILLLVVIAISLASIILILLLIIVILFFITVVDWDVIIWLNWNGIWRRLWLLVKERLITVDLSMPTLGSKHNLVGIEVEDGVEILEELGTESVFVLVGLGERDRAVKIILLGWEYVGTWLDDDGDSWSNFELQNWQVVDDVVALSTRLDHSNPLAVLVLLSKPHTLIEMSVL